MLNHKYWVTLVVSSYLVLMFLTAFRKKEGNKSIAAPVIDWLSFLHLKQSVLCIAIQLA